MKGSEKSHHYDGLNMNPQITKKEYLYQRKNSAIDVVSILTLLSILSFFITLSLFVVWHDPSHFLINIIAIIITATIVLLSFGADAGWGICEKLYDKISRFDYYSDVTIYYKLKINSIYYMLVISPLLAVCLILSLVWFYYPIRGYFSYQYFTIRSRIGLSDIESRNIYTLLTDMSNREKYYDVVKDTMSSNNGEQSFFWIVKNGCLGHYKNDVQDLMICCALDILKEKQKENVNSNEVIFIKNMVLYKDNKEECILAREKSLELLFLLSKQEKIELSQAYQKSHLRDFDMSVLRGEKSNYFFSNQVTSRLLMFNRIDLFEFIKKNTSNKHDPKINNAICWIISLLDEIDNNTEEQILFDLQKNYNYSNKEEDQRMMKRYAELTKNREEAEKRGVLSFSIASSPSYLSSEVGEIKEKINDMIKIYNHLERRW